MALPTGVEPGGNWCQPWGVYVPHPGRQLGPCYPLSFGNASLASSLLTEADAGHTEFTDEVYQNESRYPGGEWKPAEDTYTDAVSCLKMKRHALPVWSRDP